MQTLYLSRTLAESQVARLRCNIPGCLYLPRQRQPVAKIWNAIAEPTQFLPTEGPPAESTISQTLQTFVEIINDYLIKKTQLFKDTHGGKVPLRVVLAPTVNSNLESPPVEVEAFYAHVKAADDIENTEVKNWTSLFNREPHIGIGAAMIHFPSYGPLDSLSPQGDDVSQTLYFLIHIKVSIDVQHHKTYWTSNPYLDKAAPTLPTQVEPEFDFYVLQSLMQAWSAHVYNPVSGLMRTLHHLLEHYVERDRVRLTNPEYLPSARFAYLEVEPAPTTGSQDIFRDHYSTTPELDPPPDRRWGSLLMKPIPYWTRHTEPGDWTDVYKVKTLDVPYGSGWRTDRWFVAAFMDPDLRLLTTSAHLSNIRLFQYLGLQFTNESVEQYEGNGNMVSISEAKMMIGREETECKWTHDILYGFKMTASLEVWKIFSALIRVAWMRAVVSLWTPETYLLERFSPNDDNGTPIFRHGMVIPVLPGVRALREVFARAWYTNHAYTEKGLADGVESTDDNYERFERFRIRYENGADMSDFNLLKLDAYYVRDTAQERAARKTVEEKHWWSPTQKEDTLDLDGVRIRLEASNRFGGWQCKRSKRSDVAPVAPVAPRKKGKKRRSTA